MIGVSYLLDKNPLEGLATPKEEAPRRPIMTAELFAVVRAKAAEMSATAELFVCLLWFTGHRGASVRQLRWDDIDLTAKTVHWRADVDKVGTIIGTPCTPSSFPCWSERTPSPSSPARNVSSRRRSSHRSR